MKRLALIIALLAVACGGSPSSPSGQPESFAWTVNGQSFTASSNGRGALRPPGLPNVSLIGTNCSSGAGVSILLTNAAAAGTFPVGQGATVTWTPDARTGASAQERWEAPGGGGFTVGTGSGTVTVASLSSNWVSGSFTVVVAPWFTNQDKTPRTLTGTFELSFDSRTIC